VWVIETWPGGEAGANGPRQQLMTLTPTNPRCKPQQ
jgi:hypothetical protein